MQTGTCKYAETTIQAIRDNNPVLYEESSLLANGYRKQFVREAKVVEETHAKKLADSKAEAKPDTPTLQVAAKNPSSSPPAQPSHAKQEVLRIDEGSFVVNPTGIRSLESK